MEQSKSAFAKALKALQDAKDKVTSILSGEEHSYVLLGITAHLDKTINRLSFLSGQTLTKEAGDGFEPITEGLEDFKRTPLLTDEDLSPEEADRAAFLAKVDMVEQAVVSLSPEAVVHNFTQPDDILALRGVAKRYGLEDYDTAEITPAFVIEILEAINQKMEEDAALLKAEKEVAKADAAAKAEAEDSGAKEAEKNPKK